MNKTVIIDSHIFIWGIKGQATEGQEANINRAKDLIEYLASNKYQILIPVPQLVELISILPVSEQDKTRQFFDDNFMVCPFDELAGIKCAELLHLSLTDPEIKQLQKEGEIPKNRIKYDCMIVATGIVRGVSKIYSEDADFKRFAHGQIDVFKMPTFDRERNLFGESGKLKIIE